MAKPTASDTSLDTSVEQTANRDSIFLTVGTAVSAKYRGAFCEATVDEVDLSFRLRVQLQNNTKDVVSVDQNNLVSGTPLPNNEVTVRIPSSDVRSTSATAFVERVGTVLRATDTSLYTVVFDDGDKRTLRRTQLVIKGERHFKESESLDCLPLTNPEQFRQPVIDHRKHRSGNEDSDDDMVDNASIGEGAYTPDDHRLQTVGELETGNRTGGSFLANSAAPLTECDQFSDVSDDKPADTCSLSMGNTATTSVSVTSVSKPVTEGSTVMESTMVKTSSTSISEDRGTRVEFAQQAAYTRLLGRLVLVNMPISNKDHNPTNIQGSSLNASDTLARRRFGPCLVVLPSAMPNIDLRSGSRLPQLLVRSFKDNRYFGVPLCYLKRLKRPAAVELAHSYPLLRTAFERALLWLDRYELPVSWGENATQSLLGAKNWRAAKREQRAARADVPKLTKLLTMKPCKARNTRSASPYSSVSSADEVPAGRVVEASTPIKRSRTVTSPGSSRKLHSSRKRPRQSEGQQSQSVGASSRKKMRLKLTGSKATRHPLRPNSPRKSMLSRLQRKSASRAGHTHSRTNTDRSVVSKAAHSDASVDGHQSRSNSVSPQSPRASSATTPRPVAVSSTLIRSNSLSSISDGSSESSTSSSSSSVCSTSSSSSSDTESTTSSSSPSSSSSSSSSTTSSTNFEARDRWIAQLYRFMDEGGTPINKAPCLANKDLDLYKLYRLVKKLGGFHRVTAQMKWGYIYSKLHLPQHFTAGPRSLQAAFKRYLYPLDDISRKLGTELDELPLARPRVQTLANQTGFQSTKSGTGSAQSTGSGSRQQNTTTSSSTSSGKSFTAQSKTTEKNACPTSGSSITPVMTAPTLTTPNSKESSPPKVASIEPIVESTSFSSPPVLSPLTTAHEQSPSPETVRSSRSGSKREIVEPTPAEGTDASVKQLDGPSETRSSDKSRESELPRKRSFADAWKTSSTLFELPANNGVNETQLNQVIPIGSRVRVRCGDRVAYEAKVLKHIRPQPELCPRGADSKSSTTARAKFSASSEMQYRVHYMGWNRRHDEVVARSRIISIVKWARPMDSLRPPSCSSLNLVVQEPRSKPWSSARHSTKQRRALDTGRSSDGPAQTRVGRNAGLGGQNKRGARVPGKRRPYLRKSTEDKKDEDEDEEENEGEEDDEDDEDDIEVEENDDGEDEDEADVEDDSDQSQTTETASDIVTTLAPIVRRRRLVFGKPLTPNRRRTRNETARRTVPIAVRSELGSTKRLAAQDGSTESSIHVTGTAAAGCSSEHVKPELDSTSRLEVAEASIPAGKRARLALHSTEKHSPVPETPDLGKMKQVASNTSSTRSAAAVGAVKLEADTEVESVKRANQSRTESTGPPNKRKSVTATQTPGQQSSGLKTSAPIKKSAIASSGREKTDRSVLKRHVTYGAKRVSLIKGDKLRSLKRTISGVGNTAVTRKRIIPLRSGSTGSTSTIASSVTHPVVVDEARKQSASTKTTEGARTTRTPTERKRGVSTERIKPTKATSSQSASDKPNASTAGQRSVSPPFVSKPIKGESTCKSTGSKSGSDDKDSGGRQPGKPRGGKSLAETKGPASRSKPKTTKSEATGTSTLRSNTVSKTSPTKRATQRGAQTPIQRSSRVRSPSGSPSSDSSSSQSGTTSFTSRRPQKPAFSSKDAGSTTQTEIRRGRDAKRGVCAKRGRPVRATGSAVGSGDRNSSSSRSSRSRSRESIRSSGRSNSSSSSSSSDYGNMDALPRLTRSQHRQLLGDTPPGAALQTAAPIGVTTGSNVNTVAVTPIKPEPQTKDTTPKSTPKSESKDGLNVDESDKKPIIVEEKTPDRAKVGSTIVSPSQADSAIPSLGEKKNTQTLVTAVTSTPVVVSPGGSEPDKGTTKPPVNVKSEQSPELVVREELSVVSSPSPTTTTKLRSRNKAGRSAGSSSNSSGARERHSTSAKVSQLEDTPKARSVEVEHHDTQAEHEEEEEDEQSSVHTVSTDPMKGVLFDLTMSPEAATPIRSASLSVSSATSSASSSDSEVDKAEPDDLSLPRRVTTRAESEKQAELSNYRRPTREFSNDKDEVVEEEDEASTDADAVDEDEEDDNASAPSTTGGSKRSVRLRKRTEVLSRGSAEPESEDKSRRTEQDPAAHKSSTRRRRTSVSSSTDNTVPTTGSRKGSKRQHGTPQRSIAFDRSPTPSSDSPHYPQSPTPSSITVASSCAPATPTPVCGTKPAPQPRLLATQRRFGGPFFPIHGLDEMHTEAKCQILQDRMQQIVEAWRLAKQYLKDLDQRTNRTRRLRARSSGQDPQSTGSMQLASKLSNVTNSTSLTSTTNPDLGSAADHNRVVAPI